MPERTARSWVPCARWVLGVPTVAPAKMRWLGPFAPDGRSRLRPLHRLECAGWYLIAPDGRARPCPVHPLRCGGRGPLRPDGHAFPGLGCPETPVLRPPPLRRADEVGTWRRRTRRLHNVALRRPRGCVPRLPGGHVEPGPSCSAERSENHTRWRPAGPAPSFRHTRKGAVERHPRIRKGTLSSVRCDPKDRGGELALCPSGHGASAPVWSADRAGSVALCPKTRCLRAVAARRSRWVGGVVPEGHAASCSDATRWLTAKCLALRPVNALLPRRCYPGDALLEATRGLRWLGSAAFGGRGARHPL